MLSLCQAQQSPNPQFVHTHVWANAESCMLESPSSNRKKMEKTGDADRMEGFIKTETFCESSMEASVAMDLCFSGPCDCQLRGLVFFPNSCILIKSVFRADF